MIDVKKLTIGFLILAVAGSASALIIGSFGNSIAANNPSATPGATVAAADGSTNQDGGLVGNNAFEPSPTQDPTVTDPATQAIANDPNNLTNILASSYLNGLVAVNPNGPQTDGNGNATLTPPDSDTIISQLLTTSTIKNLDVPNWDTEAAEIPIHVIAVSTSGTIANYSTALQDIFDTDFVKPNLEGMMNQSSDPSAASYIQPRIVSALKDIAGLQTPQPAVNFQKDLVTILVYEKNTLALVQNGSVDPLKTALILQAEGQKYNDAISNLQTELQKVSLLPGFSHVATTDSPASGAVAFVDNVLGIKTAHAIFGLGDITFDPSVFAQMLISYANNIILQILKNFVTHLMQNTVLKWVQGNGVPRFIQNWGTTFVTAYTNAALNAINSQFACINSAQASTLKVLLIGPTINQNANVCASQFQNQLQGNNLTTFYNKFSSGGISSYFSLFQPGGNVFGAMLSLQDTGLNAGASAAQAAQTKAIANQGWNGSQACADGSNPDAPHYVCPDGSKASTDGFCFIVGQTPILAAIQPSNGLCANGQPPLVTSPGQVTGQVFNSAIDSSGKLTAAANDVAGLLDAFLSSLMNSLAQDAISAAGGELNAIGTSGSGGGGGGGASSATSVALQCVTTPNTPNPGSYIFTATGGQTISASGAVSTPSYSWTATGGIPTAGSGTSFSMTCATPGACSVTVFDTTDGVSQSCGTF